MTALEKTCRGCGEVKPLDTGFYRDQSKRLGYASRCKACMDAANEEWRRNNPDATAALQARKYRNNIVQRKTYGAEYARTHREQINARRRTRAASKKTGAN
jgi:hypothetical protein